MTSKQKLDSMPPDHSNQCIEHAPLPIARMEGATHVVRYVNSAFCRLTDKAMDQLVGHPFSGIWPEKGEFVALLDRVYRTGKSESYTRQEHSDPRPVFQSYTIWPVMADGRTVAVMVQVIESAPLYEQALAMNEALILGSLRQHELTESANLSNTHLQMEVGERKQREHDAQMLTHEVSHRIKNNLQIVVGLIAHEARGAPTPCVPGYEAIQARIVAIAELYDLISQSSRGQSVPVDAYLREIAKTMTASLLGKTSNIAIEVEAEAVEIDPVRAVPFGLLVNELATNAVKHAFPDGTGRVLLSVRQVGDQIELSVADNGVGMSSRDSAKSSKQHGANYVAIFVRQLGGILAVDESAGPGTTVRIRLPLLAVP
jgi:two-component sensor histidine kinase